MYMYALGVWPKWLVNTSKSNLVYIERSNLIAKTRLAGEEN